MQDLKVSLVQTEVYWQDIQANLAHFEEIIGQLEEDTDVIILPEMFSTGFTMAAETLAEPMNLHTFRWMRMQAKQTGAVLTGSYIVREHDCYYNRLIWMKPDGNYEVYDKRHLFRMAGEHEIFSPGKKRMIFEWKGWRIMPSICYDIRFPVWHRNVDCSYDLMFCVANWPAPRRHAWGTLLRARAIENMSYVVGVNRIGEDGNEVNYSGDSAVVDPKGDAIFEAEDKEMIRTESLSCEALSELREKFPVHKDADDFELKE